MISQQRNVMPSLVTFLTLVAVFISAFSSIPSASSFQPTIAIPSLSSVSSSVKFSPWPTLDQSWCSRTPSLRYQWPLSVHPTTHDDNSHTLPSSNPRRTLIISALSLATTPSPPPPALLLHRHPPPRPLLGPLYRPRPRRGSLP